MAPKRTIPICKGMVPTRLEKKFSDGLKKNAKIIPKNIEAAALPTIIEIIKIKPNIKLINLRFPSIV